MNNRSLLNRELSVNSFKNYYYLKEELVCFCRQEGLQTSGGKVELTDRISHYLDTGEKLTKKSFTKGKPEVGTITEDTIIEDNFICTQKHRAFFINTIGKSFSFPVPFQKWLKANAGKTYREAIEAYEKIRSDKKNGRSQIDKQFEYNTYIRDFFADNQGKSLEDAIRCWNYKKKRQGSHRYEKTDIAAVFDENQNR